MKKQIKLFILAMGLIAITVSCKSKGTEREANLDPAAHKVKVEEVIQTSNYTYIRASENENEVWLAVTRQEVEKGKTYYFKNELLMNNFESKELKRTFGTILFVQQFTTEPILVNNPTAQGAAPQGTSPGSKQAVPEKKTVKVEPADGGITIEKLFSQKSTYSGKSVKIRGEVVKFSPEIMGKNWIHIQDGTASGIDYDLTITTMEKVNVGDVVVFEGNITLDKDFGAGYAYSLIMEDAVLVKK
jgi:hypothetical protein